MHQTISLLVDILPTVGLFAIKSILFCKRIKNSLAVVRGEFLNEVLKHLQSIVTKTSGDNYFPL